MDCDVEAFPDTLARITAIYGDDPDIVALTGVWVKEQRTRAFFPNFKALRDWSYWINERDKSGYYFLFSTRIASIKKTVFQRLGGFDEEYNAPLVEDIELTYRIARRYAIIFAPDVRVRHEFEDFWPIAKKYFLRAFYWTRLYRRRKRFDPVATTLQEAMTSISGVGILVLGALAVLGVFMTAGVMTKPLMAMVIVWAFTFAAHVFLVRRFLYFVYQEKGFSFMMKSIFIGLVLYCIIFAGALAGQIRTTDSNTK
jgi:GT2 family glycosyltransferase